MKKFIFVFLIFFVACGKPQIIKTGSSILESLRPTNPEKIIIYRSDEPNWKYKEIGTVTVKGIANLNKIFFKFRNESAKYGADAIIYFDLDSELKPVTTSTSTTSSSGVSTTTTTTTMQPFYTASGTLIHRIYGGNNEN